MKYKALVSFTGLLSMAMGEVRDISDPSISSDLLKAGYIEEFKGDKKPEAPKAETEEAPKVEATEKEEPKEAPKPKKTTKPAKKRSSK